MRFQRSFRPSSKFLIAGLCCLVAAACSKSEQGAASGMGGDVIVTTAVLSERPWNDTISALGTVKARESITVTAKVSEVVQRVNFESGDQVKAGATLVTLSGNQQQAALEAAEATAREAAQAHKRNLELVEQQLISRSTLDTQRALYESSKARVEQMRADIGDRVIRAPFAGVLGIRQISQGSLITPGTVIVSLDDISRVYVDFPVPESQLAHLATGQVLSGSSVAWPDVTFEGEVSVIDARVDEATRSVVVRGDFPNAEHRLRPGMLLQVVLKRPERQALVVPELAVVQVGRDTFIWRVKADNTVGRVTVAVGERGAGSAEIIGGVQDGDRIVIDGTGKLRAGLTVKEAPAGVATPGAAAAASSGRG